MADYTILLIDYEPRSIRMLRAPLERAGYRVEVATDGQAGIQKFHLLKPSAVIIEAMLPKRHGFEVCRDLKMTPHGALCPVMIATSVYKGRKYRHQATHQYKCDAYLEKPIADEDLIGALEAGLRAYSGAGEASQDEDLEIDTVLLSEEVSAGSSAVAEEDPEFEIVDRLDALLSDDPSKNSPTGSEG